MPGVEELLQSYPGYAGRLGRVSEHPLEDRVHFPEVVIEVEQAFELLCANMRRNLAIVFEQIEQRELAVRFPHLHRIALDERVGILAAETGLRQREQDALRMDQASHAVEVLLHPLRIDEQLLDDACQSRQREVQRDGRVRPDEALDR